MGAKFASLIGGDVAGAEKPADRRRSSGAITSAFLGNWCARHRSDWRQK
jgi:hypothetical protein